MVKSNNPHTQCQTTILNRAYVSVSM